MYVGLTPLANVIRAEAVVVGVLPPLSLHADVSNDLQSDEQLSVPVMDDPSSVVHVLPFKS
jgi:hypothetical protein